MSGGTRKKVELGRSGTVTFHLSENGKKLLIEFDIEKEGFSKAGLNGFIDALKKIRDKMVR